MLTLFGNILIKKKTEIHYFIYKLYIYSDKFEIVSPN